MRERERVYRERIEADDAFIERLLTSALPSALAKRVRAGQTQWTENVPTGAVLALAIDDQHGAGAEELPALLSEAFETVREEAAERGLEACVLRPRGVLVAAASSEAVPGDIARLADLAIALETGDVGRTLRGGLHAGPFVAGLVGGSGVRFDLWGEGVDTAEAVADRAAGGAILVSPTAHGLLNGDFHLDSHGVGEVAGKGRMRLHTLRGRAT
jgi:adenylate cyclase